MAPISDHDTHIAEEPLYVPDCFSMLTPRWIVCQWTGTEYIHPGGLPWMEAGGGRESSSGSCLLFCIPWRWAFRCAGWKWRWRWRSGGCRNRRRRPGRWPGASPISCTAFPGRSSRACRRTATCPARSRRTWIRSPRTPRDRSGRSSSSKYPPVDEWIDNYIIWGISMNLNTPRRCGCYCAIDCGRIARLVKQTSALFLL